MKRRVNFLLVAMASVLMCQAQKPISADLLYF